MVFLGGSERAETTTRARELALSNWASTITMSRHATPSGRFILHQGQGPALAAVGAHLGGRRGEHAYAR
eukprot:6277825-Alexandrium_andersonii.AAC.1